ncbi:prolyl-tRNA synthetase [Paragonimus westermani]|uniref:proline--tRNA ligase n=1 Tax=Paragonimus westermani TaxID=34504 RepID=A0A5J4NSD9_9TREM|nr:prolyl-tRNA synthetase [Paragonimus westermani]
MTVFSYFSRCFIRRTVVFPKSIDVCLSQHLLQHSGLIALTSPGIFSLSPVFIRVLDKLVNLVKTKMATLGAQQMLLPTVGNSNLWTTSGRWNNIEQLFRVKDRNGKYYCLQPTYEEEVTSLLTAWEVSYKDLPILLYQVSNKYRDELRPKHGLLRCREFMMKDLYSFDADLTDALETYKNVCDSYADLLSTLGLPYYKVCADAGHIGGQLSHEFHIPLPIGEDLLYICNKCGTGVNAEYKGLSCYLSGHIFADQSNILHPTDTECSHNFTEVRGVEVGHCFLLGQRYSKCFNATFDSPKGKKLFEMGCFGLGLTRLLAASIEHFSAASFPDLSADEITEIRWPPGISPFTGAVALQKESAKDALSPSDLKLIMDAFNGPDHNTSRCRLVPGDILIDDRKGLSLGRKLIDLKRLGIPWIVIAKVRFTFSFMTSLAVVV